MDESTGETPRHRHPGDGWIDCTCGRRHWGLNGAAGVFLVRLDPTGRTVADVALQHRVLWSDEGGTWGIPGGAIADGESARDGGLREASEEAGIDPALLRIVATVVLDHRTWRYTTVIATEAPGQQIDPHPTDPESLDVRWVPLDEVAARPLMRAFAEQLPVYLAALNRGLRALVSE